MAAPVALGIAGTGTMAAVFADLAGHLPDVTAAAVLSRDAARARRFADRFGIPAAHDTTEGFLLTRGLSAVYIATGNAAHADLAEAAIGARLPCLVEKPMTTGAERTRALADRARAESSLLMENLWTLALPAYRALKDRAGSGRFGAPRHFVFDFSIPVSRTDAPGMFNPVAGGVILDRAIYGAAAAIDLLGPVVDVAGHVFRDTEGTDVSCAFQTRHNGGATAHIWVSMNGFGANVLDLALSEGNLRLGPPSLGAEWLTSARFGGAAPARAEGGDGAAARLKARLKAMPAARRRLGKAARAGETREFVDYGVNQYAPVLSHFADLVRADCTESDLVPLALSVAAMDVVSALRALG